MESFDALAGLVRDGGRFEDVQSRILPGSRPRIYEELDLTLFPDDAELWDFMVTIVDYDPRQALERISVPVLALFGADDALVPVDGSVAVYRAAVRRDLLTVAVFPGADHRVRAGDPPQLADGYLGTLSSFVRAAVA